MSSCLYQGNVYHHRYTPKTNSFNYKVNYFFLDLDEVSRIFSIPFLLSYNSIGIISFNRKNFFGDRKLSLKDSIYKYIQEKTNDNFTGTIKLLTSVSYFGFCFNPVSFYYCYELETNKLKYIISEITNTPWGEKNQRLFTITQTNNQSYTFEKDFHVSPFIPMEVNYLWNFEIPNDKLTISMKDFHQDNNQLFFEAGMNLKKIPITTMSIILSFFSHPLMSFKTYLAIYYQALHLFIKKVPFYSHPKSEGIHG